MSATEHRREDETAIRAFADRHGLTCTGTGVDLRAEGSIDATRVSITKVRRGTGSNPCWATRFSAFAPAAFPGALVVFKPNFWLRLPGPRRVRDDIGRWGLLGFVHHDAIDDRELDRKLVIQTDDVAVARASLTRDATKRAILDALDAAGHIRIQGDEVALERAERIRGLVTSLTPAQVDQLALAAVAVVQTLGAMERR